MSLNKKIDDWFLGYKTRAVKAKDRGAAYFGKGRPSKPLKPGSGLANLTAAAKKHPEVMVKIPKRLSRFSKGMRGVANHLDYISRNGKIRIETQDGEKLDGKKAVKSLTEDWKKLGIPDHSKHREALNIVLSMPAGTPPQAVLNAARNFAAEQFPDRQYALALHHESEKTDEPEHPHVHLCVLMRDAFGERLNPRKNDLFEWRVRFAEKLREEGVECAATKRVHRGIAQKTEKSAVRAIRARGKWSNTALKHAQELVAAVEKGERPTHPYLQKVLNSRGAVLEEYGQIAKELYKMGNKTEARLVSRLAKETASRPFETKAQQAYDHYAARPSEFAPYRTAVEAAARDPQNTKPVQPPDIAAAVPKSQTAPATAHLPQRDDGIER